MSAYINKILKAIQWHEDTGGIHGTLLSLTECYDIKGLVDRLRQESKCDKELRDNAISETHRLKTGLEDAIKINQKTCLECKQLSAIEAGREGYLQGLEFAATVADEMTQTPQGAWGNGAKYNAEKIAKICREESGGDISWMAELKEERNRWYGKAISRQLEINKLGQVLIGIAELCDFPGEAPPSRILEKISNIAKEALREVAT